MPRLTIGQMMTLVAVSAGAFALFPYFFGNLQLVIYVADRLLGRGAYVFYALFLASAVLAGYILRRRPRLAAWAFVILAAPMNVSSAVVCVYLYSIGGLMLMSLITYLLMPFTFISGTAWAYRSARPPRLAAMVIVYAIGLMPLLIPATTWPLRLAAFVSRPWLDRLADRVAAGQELSKPEWAGLYRIVDAKRQPDNGNVALIIDANPAGRSAFVRYPGSLDVFGPMVNLNFNEPLGGKWFYQNED